MLKWENTFQTPACVAVALTCPYIIVQYTREFVNIADMASRGGFFNPSNFVGIVGARRACLSKVQLRQAVIRGKSLMCLHRILNRKYKGVVAEKSNLPHVFDDLAKCFDLLVTENVLLSLERE
jgi:hypothetical protein